MKGVADEIKAGEARLEEIEETLRLFLLVVPNLPDDSVPVGRDAEANVEVRRVGEPPEFDFTPRAHWDVGTELGLLDFERAAKVSGARFAFAYGTLARLERALVPSCSTCTRASAATARWSRPTWSTARPSPAPASSRSSRATSSRPGSGSATCSSSPPPRCRSPTSTRTRSWRPETLPRKYAAFTPCFRSEAGSYGKDVRGLIRQHQFHKVELVKLTAAETSMDELESMIADAEEVLKRLGLAYRVVRPLHRRHGVERGQDLRHRGLAARAERLPRDLLLLELHRLPGAPRPASATGPRPRASRASSTP